LPAHVFAEREIDITMKKYNYVRKLSFSCKEDQVDGINFIGIFYCKEIK